MVKLALYSPDQKCKWDEFVKTAKNATFIHLRDYMDYHRSRFSDCSIIAYNDNKIIAVLPANRVDDTLYSHQGLTFGGWLTQAKHFDITTMLQIFDEMHKFLPAISISKLIYKPSPHIYHSYPSEEDIYAIFRNDGKLISSNISATVPLDNALRFNENSRRAMKFAVSEGITITESLELDKYWEVLSALLHDRYSTKPVHTLQEIELLKSRFPKNIRLFTANLDGRVLGGVLIYDTGLVAHSQYIAASEEGKEKKVLPLVFDHLIQDVFKDRKYFDFGTSNEENGRYLNKGLSMQKTGMGGRGIVYNTFEITF